MNQFLLHLVSTLIGFCFAIVLFVVQEKLREKIKEKALIRNLIEELQYNMRIISTQVKLFRRNLYKALNHEYIFPPDPIFDDIATSFLYKSFDSGIINKYLGIIDRGNFNFALKRIRWIDEAQKMIFVKYSEYNQNSDDLNYAIALILDLSNEILDNFLESHDILEKNCSILIDELGKQKLKNILVGEKR